MKHDLKTSSGANISRYSFGTMQWGEKADETNSRAMYDACRAAGINFFDTAHGYTGGASETLLGQFAKRERDQLFIATKVGSTGNCHPDAIANDFEESLTRLDTGYVDMLYLHRFDDAVPLEDTYAAVAKMVESGRVRHIGVSNYAAWQVMKAQAVAHKFSLSIDMIQPMYSLVKRQVEVEILPMAQSENIAVVPYSPLGGGLLTGKYADGVQGRLLDNDMYKSRYGQDWMHNAAVSLSTTAKDIGVSPITLAVAWVAKNPGITAPIISASRADQLQPSLDAMTYQMDDALYARLTALTPTPAPATDRSEDA